MQFGIFDHLDRSDRPLATQFEERLTLLEAYDRAGFRGYHLAEHHCTPLGMSPSPSVFLAAAAQRTRRIRLGALVYTLSLYHPLRLLEEICMLDALTGGRLDVGIGRGVSPIELRYYGVDPEIAQQQYIEASEILLQGLGAKSLTYEGKHFQFRDVPIEMAPVQSPRPPLWYGVGQPDTAAWAAGQGIHVMCNGPATAVRRITDRFREAWAEAGAPADAMPLAGMSRHVVVADTDAEALRIAAPAYERWFASLTHLWRLHGIPLPIAYSPTFEGALQAGMCLVGSPATVLETMQAQADASGISYLLCRLAFGNLSLAHSLQSVALLQREVMPHVSAAKAIA